MVDLEPVDVEGLTYSHDSQPGFTRRRAGTGFTYRDERGRTIRDAATLRRLRALAVPPAWTDVWLSPDPRGHIQATGRDAKGRKQYRYHRDWTRHRDEAKFGSLGEFGRALPVLRERVAEDMADRSLSRERVVATTVWLLDRTLVRVGNSEYAEDSRGLTTLLDGHAKIKASSLRFRFVGKSGALHDVEVNDRRVARTVARCRDLPGQHLLQYLDGNDEVCQLGSRDVNDYLRETTKGGFTAKTFRTWGASAGALELLAADDVPDSEKAADASIRRAIEATAGRLRNTPAVCRASYIHPVVLDAFRTGALHDDRRRRGSRAWLSDAERRLLAILEQPTTTGSVSDAAGDTSRSGPASRRRAGAAPRR